MFPIVTSPVVQLLCMHNFVINNISVFTIVLLSCRPWLKCIMPSVGLCEWKMTNPTKLQQFMLKNVLRTFKVGVLKMFKKNQPQPSDQSVMFFICTVYVPLNCSWT